MPRSREPYAYSAADRYCRLGAPFTHRSDSNEVAERLAYLAGTMLRLAPVRIASPMRAGYTYFGQFIFHDMTGDETPIGSAGAQEPEETRNYRTPALDLDSVYGDGPGSDKHGHLFNDDGSFVLGRARRSDGALFDVPIHFGPEAVVDVRNLENAITRQVHALFMLLHNTWLAEASAPSAQRRFDDTRSRVRRQFHSLVRRDFCSAICDPTVLGDAPGSWPGERFQWSRGRFSIPVEFAQGVGRVGHSLVRENYRLQRTNSRKFDLTELFDPKLRRAELPPEMALGWHHFFSSAQAMRLNRHIVDPLARLPNENVDLYVASPPPHAPFSLAERTLKRGAANRLPTGQAMCKELKLARPTISRAQTPRDQASAWDDLQSVDMHKATPLWYYILLEAELKQGGSCLGPLGSRLLLDVVGAAVSASEDAMSQGSPVSSDPHHRRDSAVRNLVDVARVVGLESN